MPGRGGLLKLLDAYIAIGGDTSAFDRALGQSETKAKQSGSRIESLFSPRRVLGALGAAAGTAFGVALTGANQLDAATRQLQADTGMTAEEANKAQGALAGMYRNNLQGFDEISAAMASVHNDLGLTGKAADETTARFLKFSTATRQDAAGAVTAFDDILDAWNMTATESGPIMDKLIASHQKYGGSITENQKALAQLAPQLSALGVSIDGGIELLNLFAASGLDSSKATFALNTAVQKLKPGQNLDDLVAQIASIEDPTLRAQKAVEIFGARGGVSLANALRPGITGLSDFAVSSDAVAGATDKAAAAVESGFGNQFKIMMKNAGGALAKFGTQFGPLLYVAAAFGPKFTAAISAGLGGLAGTLAPVLAGQLTTLFLGSAVEGPVLAGAASLGRVGGLTMGTAFAAAATAAIAAAPIAVLTVAIRVQSDINSQGDALLMKTREYVKTATDAQIKGSIEGVQSQLDGMVFNSYDSKNKVIAVLNTLIEEANRRGVAAIDGVSLSMETLAVSTRGAAGASRTGAVSLAGLAMSAKDVQAWTNKAKKELPPLADAIRETARTARQSRLDVAWGIAELPDQIIVAKQAVRDAEKDVTTTKKDEHAARVALANATTKGEKKAAAASLAAAQAAAAQARIRLAEAKREVDGLHQKLVDSKTDMGAAGKMIGELIGKGIYQKVVAWNSLTLAELAKLGHVQVRPSVIFGGGEPLESGMPYVAYDNMPALLHQGEAVLTAPQAQAWRSSGASQSAAPGAGGTTNNISVTVAAQNAARDPFEIATQMRRLARFGVLTPAPRMA